MHILQSHNYKNIISHGLIEAVLLFLLILTLIKIWIKLFSYEHIQNVHKIVLKTEIKRRQQQEFQYKFSAFYGSSNNVAALIWSNFFKSIVVHFLNVTFQWRLDVWVSVLFWPGSFVLAKNSRWLLRILFLPFVKVRCEHKAFSRKVFWGSF